MKIISPIKEKDEMKIISPVKENEKKWKSFLQSKRMMK